MSQKPTVKDLQKIASSKRNWKNGKNAENKCGTVSRSVADELKSRYPSLQQHSLKCQGYVGDNSIGHWFVVIPADKVSSRVSGPVIVDAAIEQFCQENAKEQKSAITEPLHIDGDPVESSDITREDFVLTPEHAWYSKYRIDWCQDDIKLR